MQVKTHKDLEKFLLGLNIKIANAQVNEVSKTVKSVMKDNVQTEVYDVYTPTMYSRTGLLGSEGSMESKMINGTTLIVENVRSDGERNVAEIVESGMGYEYGFEYAGVPRPFTEATREDLRSTGAHFEALVRGLKRQGIKTK